MTNRLIKVFANASKGLGYAVHLALPNKRFKIPRHRPALFRSRSGGYIPRTVWQTNFTNQVTLPVYLNYLFNRAMSLGCEYRFVSTEERAEFVRSRFPGPVNDCYSRLRIGAAQADFWRVLVLKDAGGIYMDIDAHLVWPVETLITPDDHELFVLDRTGRITNFFMASAPGNPLLSATVDRIVENISSNASQDIWALTGPGALQSALDGETFVTDLYRNVCDQGNFTNEYFQYRDHPHGKWTRQQRKMSPLAAETDRSSGPDDAGRSPDRAQANR